MKRIGLLGGSFDPPHNGHLALAHVALEHLRLDALWWLPQGNAYQKSRALSDARDRRAMVELAVAGEPRFRLEDCELRRDGPTYTVDTLRELQVHDVAEWFLVIGQDQYANLHTWHEWRELLQRVTLAIASRDGAPPMASAEVSAVPHRVATLPLPRIDVSSTAIRTAAAEGRDYTDMVPGPIARYIDQHHLYRGTPRS